MLVLPKVIYRFNGKVHMESQGTLNNQNNPEKEEKVGGLTLPNLKLESYSNQSSVVLT